MSGWVLPSFSKKLAQLGRGETDQKSATMNPQVNDLWSEIFEPQKEDDLAVNPKKVLQVKDWLNSALSGEFGRSPVAVFSGPSGSGKTATIRVLSKSMGITLKEWASASSTMAPSSNTFEQARGRFDYDNSSQVKQFEDFLFRASRYSTVFDDADAEKSVLLVEDIPNIYIHDPSFLQKTLQKYAEYGLSPIIFICSSGSHDFNLERILFKPQLVKDLKISIISFNPTNITLLRKALWRVIHLVSESNHSLINATVKSSVYSVADSSNNDLRFAINQLQFICCGAKGPDPCYTHKPKFMKRMDKSKPKKNEKHINECILRDPCADVFRCLGRVLYCKKVKVVDDKTKIAKEQFSHDPFQIINSMYSVPNLFQDLLNENYLTVFNDIKKIADAGESLCLSDNLMVRHRNRDSDINYSMTISVLGLMNASNDNIIRKFNPFRGSKAKEAMTSCKEKLQTCKHLFPESTYEPRTLLGEVFPFMVKFDTSILERDKKRFVRSVAEITSVSAKSSGILDEESSCDSALAINSDVKVGECLSEDSQLHSNVIFEKKVPVPTAENVDDEVIIIEEDDST